MGHASLHVTELLYAYILSVTSVFLIAFVLIIHTYFRCPANIGFSINPFPVI